MPNQILHSRRLSSPLRSPNHWAIIARSLLTLAAVSCGSVSAQIAPVPPADEPVLPATADNNGPQEEPGPQVLADSARRKIQDLMVQVRESQATEPIRAAELFDAAWQLAVAREDPLVELNTDAFDLLEPGEHQVNAGSRSQLIQLYRESPPAFRRAYQQLVAADADQALRPDPAASPAEVTQKVLRYQFTDQGRQTLELLVHLLESRGEFLNAALEYGRLLQLQENVAPEQQLRLAVLWWKAGLPDEAESYIRNLLPQHAGQQLRFDAHSLQLPDTQADVADWLVRSFGAAAASTSTRRDWSQMLGGYRRTELQEVGPPELIPQWSASSFECVWKPDLKVLLEPLAEAIERLAMRALKAGNTVAPAAIPLVTDDLVVFRGVANLRAVDRDTGELRWETAFVDQQLQSALEAVYRAGPDEPGNLDLVQSILRSSLFSHLVRTDTGGQLTRAGDLLFAVEEVTSETMTTDWDTEMPASQRAVNYLRAYDLRSGQTVGVLGGTVGLARADRAANPLRGFFVLGTPLVIGERIYLMAENDQGIFLLQLLRRQFDQRRGPISQQPVHSQLLSIPRHGLRNHPVRSQAGLSPSFGQGLLICNTCDEKIIAVSAEDHSVRWIYRYPSNVGLPELNRGDAVIGNASSLQASNESDLAIRWQDSLPRIVQDRVFVTPRDSDRLVCLDLLSGREVWTRPRGRNRRLVYVDAEKLILTGNSHVECLNAADGSVIWQTQLAGGTICGNAAVSTSIVQVPTSDPAVVSLRLSDGRQLLQQPLRQTFPGNLLSLDGQLFVQSLTQVTCLATKNENSPLAEAASEFLAGRTDEAETRLQQLLADEGSVEQLRQARQLLIESLLEGLRLDYEQNQDRVTLLQDLIEQNRPDLARLQQLMADALNVSPATLQDLIPAIDSVDDSHIYRQRLQVLRAQHQFDDLNLTPDAFITNLLEVLDRAFQQDDAAMQEGMHYRRTSRIALASTYSALQRRPDADDLRQKLAQPLEDRILAAETEAEAYRWVDAALTVGVTEAVVGAVLQPSSSLPEFVLDLAWFSSLQNGPVSAEDRAALNKLQGERRPLLLSRLATRTEKLMPFLSSAVEEIPADVQPAADFLLPLNATETVSQIEQLKAASTEQSRPPVWPGTPQVEESAAHSVRPDVLANPHALIDQIPIRVAEGSFTGWALARVTGVDGIVALDQDGNQRWVFQPASLMFSSGGQYGPRYNRLSDHYAVAYGSLMAIKMHHLVFMLDCSNATPERPPEMLWRINLFQQLDLPSFSQRADPAWQRTTQYDLRPAGLFPMGPLTKFGLPLYSGRELMMAGLNSGEALWRVTGLPDDCLLTATDQNLVLISEAAGMAEFRNPIDGSVQTRTPLPQWWTEAAENSNSSIRDFTLEPGEEQRWRLRLHGQHCLLLVRSLQETRLEQFDLQTAAVDWTLTLPQDTVISNIVDNHLALLSDGDRLQILHLAAGLKIADLKVTAANGSRELYLRPAADRWIVFTDVFDQEHDEQNPVGATTSVQINGPVYAVRAHNGQLDWTANAEHEFLRILHPAQFPFPAVTPLLVMLKQPYRRSPEGLIRGAVVQARILDARTGQQIYSANDLGYGLSYHRLCPIADEQKIQISFDKRTVTFYYSTAADSPPSGK
ncbi:MAG: hypothetical protein Fues2KO_02560 [Fuerstiella sp.]